MIEMKFTAKENLWAFSALRYIEPKSGIIGHFWQFLLKIWLWSIENNSEIRQKKILKEYSESTQKITFTLRFSTWYLFWAKRTVSPNMKIRKINLKILKTALCYWKSPKSENWNGCNFWMPIDGKLIFCTVKENYL